MKEAMKYLDELDTQLREMDEDMTTYYMQKETQRDRQRKRAKYLNLIYSVFKLMDIRKIFGNKDKGR